MGTKFSEFMDDLEREAVKEGPEAVAELRLLHQRFALAQSFITARKIRGVTQKDLARRTGLNQSEISNLESGQANATYRTLQTVASALGARIELVLGKAPRRVVAHRIARAPKRTSARGRGRARS